MFEIHDINDLHDLRLYIHETNHMFYFVNADNVYQTILLRLPPVFVVQQYDNIIQYHLSDKVNKAIRTIENEATILLLNNSSITNAPISWGSREGCSTTLKTRVHPTLTHSSVVNTFVEVIVSIDGIIKTDSNSEFLYHTIQMKEHKVDPPTLDFEKLTIIDLFNLKTMSEIEHNEEEWYK